jgi:rhomboid family GlyGly-CTERM serine protease
MSGSRLTQVAPPAGQEWSAGSRFVELLNPKGIAVYLIGVACLLMAPWSDSAFEYLALDQQGLQYGEVWRIWTGQFVHTSWIHLGLNIAGLIALQQIFGDELERYDWGYAVVFISAFIGIVWYGASVLGIYGSFAYVVGASALLHGLFSYAALLSLRGDKLLGTCVLLVIGAKIAWELFAGASVDSAEMIGMPVAVETHLYGYVAGLLAGIWVLLFRRT